MLRLALLTAALALLPVLAKAQTETAAAPETSAPPLLQVSIFFAGGSAYVYPREAERLRTFLDDVPAVDNYGVQLQGHTDDIGARDYNLRLSAARVASVRAWLLDYPIEDAAIELLPLGEDAPSFSNDTWEGKLSNRRVDVILKPLM